jgi:transcriptional regulator with XRE-family HTH domain
MINLGRTAKHVRETFGLSQRDVAAKLGISSVHLCNVENGRSAPSPELVQRYFDMFGVDLYVLAFCLDGPSDRLSDGVRKAASRLGEIWKRELEKVSPGITAQR